MALNQSSRITPWLAALLCLTAWGCTPKKNRHRFGGADRAQNVGEDPAANGDAGTSGPPVVTGQTREGEVAYLERGQTMLETRLWMLDQARTSVRVQAFLFKGDEVGSRVADRLIALAKKGLKVSVAVDEVANIDMKAQVLYGRLAKNGIPIEGFDPFYLQFLDNLTAHDDVEQAIQDGNRRFHDKMFIVDGEDPERGMAIVGGANLGNEYFWFDGGDPASKWMDQDVIVRGPVVQDITSAFDENVKTMAQNGKGAVSRLSEIITGLNQKLNLNDPFEKLLKLRPALLAQVDQWGGKAPSLAWRKGRLRFTHSRPRFSEDKIYREYVDMIAAAKSTILISNSYFIPTDAMQNALADAARRGVTVKILTNAPETGDVPAVQKAGRALYDGLMTAAAKDAKGSLTIYEWKGDKVLHNGFTLHHAKYMVVDGKAAIVGSFNIDPRSQFLNSETVMVLEQSDVAASLAAGFGRDIGPGFSRAVTAQEAKSYVTPNDLLSLMEKTFLVGFRPIL